MRQTGKGTYQVQSGGKLKMETKRLKCKKCGHEWDAKYIPEKRYYPCPICRAINKKEEIEKEEQE